MRILHANRQRVMEDEVITRQPKQPINLSCEFEAHQADLIKLRKQEKWLAENREALDAYNTHIERDGVFSDDLRSF